MSVLNPTIPIVTLNSNGLKSQLKHKDGQIGFLLDHSTCCPQRNHLLDKDTGRLKVKNQLKMYRANTNQKKVGLAINIRKRFQKMESYQR